MITYTDKVQVTVSPNPDEELWRAADANEVKNEVNAIITSIDATTIVPITTNISLSAAALGKIHICTGTSLNYTVDLPTAVGNTGKSIIIKGDFSLTKVVTIQGVSGQLIDGESSRNFSADGSFTLLSDGTGWIIVNEVGSWVSYTPVLFGFSSDPTISVTSYFRVGKMCKVQFITTGTGTSNNTSKTVTAPFIAASPARATGLMFAVNNGGVLTTAGCVVTRAGSTTMDVYRDIALNAWGSSTACRFSFIIDYEIA